MKITSAKYNFTSLAVGRGFTIVELLVVIVVIGILAAITVVSYTGISSRASVSALQSDLNNASQKLKLYQTLYGSYPTALDSNNCPTTPNADTNYCLKFSPGTTYTYQQNNISGLSTFDILATKNGNSYHVADNSKPSPVIPTVASGGTVMNVGGYRIHTFTTSGNFTVSNGDRVEILIVGGGGGGGSFGGGGGAGGLIYSSSYVVDPKTYSVVIGNGGAGAAVTDNGVPGTNGQNSTFDTLAALGGGGGGTRMTCADGCRAGAGGSGGSGGGSSMGNTGTLALGGVAAIGQGNNGGQGRIGTSPHLHGGGGGAGAVGGDAVAPNAGSGGVGLAYSISGSLTYYAGGGGGGSHTDGIYIVGAGGNGGGGAGQSVTGGTGVSGTANTGGGGGGGGYGGVGGAGGSGIVIIRYPL